MVFLVPVGVICKYIKLLALGGDGLEIWRLRNLKVVKEKNFLESDMITKS